MANNRKAGEPGRYCKADAALSRQIFARATDAQHATYLALGGAAWLRVQLDAEIARQRLAPTPTAHNPFPPVQSSEPEPGGLYGFGGRLTVTDAKTGEPVPHTVTVHEF